MPPDSSCGKAPLDPLRVGQPDLAEHLTAPRPRCLALDAVGAERLDDLRPHAQQRVQRGHRVLVDHGYLGPAHRLAALARRAPRRSWPAKRDRARRGISSGSGSSWSTESTSGSCPSRSRRRCRASRRAATSRSTPRTISLDCACDGAARSRTSREAEQRLCRCGLARSVARSPTSGVRTTQPRARRRRAARARLPVEPGVIEPEHARPRGRRCRRAPWPGARQAVRKPISAKTSASLAASGMPNSSMLRRPRPAGRSASSDIRVGLRVPPPAATTSATSSRRGRRAIDLGRERRRASRAGPSVASSRPSRRLVHVAEVEVAPCPSTSAAASA